MTIGVPREVKDHETRVGLVPSGVSELIELGHTVLIESGAGLGSTIHDDEYEEAGAEVVASASEVWARSELVVKVKEPQPSEYEQLRPDLMLFTYLHLAPLPELTEALVAKKVTAIAYETIREADGSLPLLTPMSEVAGRLSVQIGAEYLEAANGGRGILLGGVPGVPPANVLILGGGTVGHNAAKVARGFGAKVTVVDKNLNRLREIDDIFNGDVQTMASSIWTIREAVKLADLVIGAVLIPGSSTPKLLRRDMLGPMKRGAVIVDVAIDQGGCFETSRPTTHTDPVFFVDDVLHYCVSNMPAAVPHTSTLALTNATLPYVRLLAGSGLAKACERSAAVAEGVNTYRGHITFPGVAESQQQEWKSLRDLL